MATAPQQTTDRTEAYMARVEEHLSGLKPDARLPWLTRQRTSWIALDERFKERIDAGLTPEFGESAFDYSLTIAALDQRIARERRALAPSQA